MKKIITIYLQVVSCFLVAQVSIGNSSPQGILDLTNLTSDSKSYPLVMPSSPNAASVINPDSSGNIKPGSIYYDTTDFCLKLYNGSYWGCLTMSSPSISLSLDCSNKSVTGSSLIENTAASGVSFEIPYTNGNGGSYSAQTINSTEVTGLTASLAAGNVNSGSGNLTFNVSGTPSASGKARFNISIAGESCLVEMDVAAATTTAFSLNCSGITIPNVTVNELQGKKYISIPYTNANAITYGVKSYQPTSSNGTLSLYHANGTLNGNGTILIEIVGTPVKTGNALFLVEFNGKGCLITVPVGGSTTTATITALNCSNRTTSGTLTEKTTASGVSFHVPYTGGNGGSYSAQTINSTGVTGLTASLAAGNVNSGSGNLTFNVSGTPSASGTARFNISIAGKSCFVDLLVDPLVTSTLSLKCSEAVKLGDLTEGVTAVNSSFNIPYTGGNGSYSAQTINSTGVTGLTASLAAGNFNSGSGNLNFTISGNPNSSGNATFPVTINGQSCPIVFDIKDAKIQAIFVGSYINFAAKYNMTNLLKMTEEEKANYPASNSYTALLSFWGGKAEFPLGGKYFSRLVSVLDPTKYSYHGYGNYGAIGSYKITLRETSHNLSDYGISVTTWSASTASNSGVTITVSNYNKFKNKVGLNGEIILSGKVNMTTSTGTTYNTETMVYIRLEEIHFRP